MEKWSGGLRTYRQYLTLVSVAENSPVLFYPLYALPYQPRSGIHDLLFIGLSMNQGLYRTSYTLASSITFPSRQQTWASATFLGLPWEVRQVRTKSRQITHTSSTTVEHVKMIHHDNAPVCGTIWRDRVSETSS